MSEDYDYEEEAPKRNPLDPLRRKLMSIKDPEELRVIESELMNKLNSFNLPYPDNCHHCWPKIDKHPDRKRLALLIEGIKLTREFWFKVKFPEKKKKKWGEI